MGEYSQALTSEPDIVVIMFGYNDAHPCNWYFHGKTQSEIKAALRYSKSHLSNEVDMQRFVVDGATSSEIKAAYAKHYINLIRSFQNLTSRPRVYVNTPPPKKEAGVRTHTFVKKLDERIFVAEHASQLVNNEILPQLVPEIAQQAGLGSSAVIDVFSALGGKNMQADMLVDGLHPTEAGLEAIARAVADTLL